MISIHHNAPTIAPSRHPGTEAFVQSNSNNSSRLGTLVYESVYKALDKFFLDFLDKPIRCWGNKGPE